MNIQYATKSDGIVFLPRWKASHLMRNGRMEGNL